jgi:hypothetical protein
MYALENRMEWNQYNQMVVISEDLQTKESEKYKSQIPIFKFKNLTS